MAQDDDDDLTPGTKVLLGAGTVLFGLLYLLVLLGDKRTPEERRADEEAEALEEFLEDHGPLIRRLEWLHDLFPHRTDPGFTAAYARAHCRELCRHRERILKWQTVFHENDALVQYLKRERPELYRVATFECRALSAVESLLVDARAPVRALPAPVRRKETFEEHRERSVRWEQAKVMDVVGRAARRREYRRRLEQLDLDPDDLERYVAEIDEMLMRTGSSHDDDN